jgi:GTP-binding protein LepA
MTTLEQIRNFCIIAHIDHGKSTLADRMLQMTNTVDEREFQDQLLDDMDLERERGITIKSHAIQMFYNYKQQQEYTFNLIDTPGHVDFSYEVSRAIKSCEGALLVVDASQGIQAQTISNLFLALEYELKIVPVINKIDLDSAMVDEVKDQIMDLTDCSEEEILMVSAKTGKGVEDIMNAIVEAIPPPAGDPESPLQALIFDSVYNPYRGVIVYFRVFNGQLQNDQRVKLYYGNKTYSAEETGVLGLKKVPTSTVSAGQVGYIISGIKSAQELNVGDTITDADAPAPEPVKGFEVVKPMVYAGIFPTDTEQYEELRGCMEKLQLNDASLVFEPETSAALGFGFRCGFLGLLHMEIVQERLNREFGIEVIVTVPNVSYRVFKNDNLEEPVIVNNPSELPDRADIHHIEEPYISASIITIDDFVGNIMELCLNRRGVLQNQVYLTNNRVELTFDMPLGEIIFDFYDKLKSNSRGYASLDYQPKGYRESHLVKLDILLNKEPVDALSAIIHNDKAYEFGKRICEKLKELLPRQQFEIAIQASVGSKVIARESVKPLKKDVTAKCYGGDVTRKRKLLEKQKKGKKKMKSIGSVEVPQKAFLAIMQIES